MVNDAIIGVVKFITTNLVTWYEISLTNERMVELDERMEGLGKSSVKKIIFETPNLSHQQK